MEGITVAVTGSTGFVGKHLIPAINDLATTIVTLGRQQEPSSNNQLAFDLAAPEALNADDLRGIDVLIHTAARAHVMAEREENPRLIYDQLNAYASVSLAKKAIEAGVKRFIYISSIKVLGEKTTIGVPFNEHSAPHPVDDYGHSKALAEQQLKDLVADSPMELVIIRPPLVYGPGVKANFALLLKLAARNYPLPLAAVTNKRSMVGIDNLVDLIKICIHVPEAAGETFLVTDDRDLSTAELLSMMTAAYGKQSRLWPFPPKLLRLAATIVGKRNIADRLFDSLQVDISHTKACLGWQPKFTVEEQLAKCVGITSND